jgi:hypothetical protein
MVKKRKSTPMETQPGRGPADIATPMAHASSKRGHVPGMSRSALPRSQADTVRKRSLKKQRSMLNG